MSSIHFSKLSFLHSIYCQFGKKENPSVQTNRRLFLPIPKIFCTSATLKSTISYFPFPSHLPTLLIGELPCSRDCLDAKIYTQQNIPIRKTLNFCKYSTANYLFACTVLKINLQYHLCNRVSEDCYRIHFPIYGYLDRLFVHKNHQRQGIATAICDELERAAIGKQITTHASITAKGFFLRRGYRVVKKQEVMRCGVLLTNFLMEK